VEPACAASLAPLYHPELLQTAGGGSFSDYTGPVVAIVCGGNGVNLDTISAWRRKLGLDSV
jgi:hypothetical protein